MTPTATAEIEDHAEIWLEPKCRADDGGDRLWCEDPLEDCEEPGCGCKAVRYVRADIAEAALRAAEAERDRMREALHWIETADISPYIQIGDDPNFPGETVMVPGRYARVARAALQSTSAKEGE